MAIFEYQALTAAGRLITGTIESDSHDQAGEVLRGMGLTINSIEKARAAKPKTPIGRSEFLLFNQQLASIARAGIPLARSLRALCEDVGSGRMQRLINSIADDLEAGVSIEEAFEKRQKYFPPLYGQIVKAGVHTGRLSEMLTSLNRHLEVSGQTRRIIFEAVCYPAVVLVMAAVILTGMLTFVVPQFMFMFEEAANLPATTRLLLKAADNVGAIWIGLGAAVLAFFALRGLLGLSAEGRRFRETILMSLPVVGRIYRASTLGRMADAMATLVAAGADMPACLRLAAGATGSETMKLQCEALAGRIEQGDDIIAAAAGCTMLPQLFLYSVRLGSQRNDLQDNLHSLAEMYARQAKINQGRLQAMLLPVLLVITGALVAFGILALFFPLVQSMTMMQPI